MGKKYTATFTCSYDLWKRFKRYSEDRGSNASAEISKYMSHCVSDDISEDTKSYLGLAIKEQVEEFISEKLESLFENKCDCIVSKVVETLNSKNYSQGNILLTEGIEGTVTLTSVSSIDNQSSPNQNLKKSSSEAMEELSEDNDLIIFNKLDHRQSLEQEIIVSTFDTDSKKINDSDILASNLDTDSKKINDNEILVLTLDTDSQKVDENKTNSLVLEKNNQSINNTDVSSSTSQKNSQRIKKPNKSSSVLIVYEDIEVAQMESIALRSVRERRTLGRKSRDKTFFERWAVSADRKGWIKLNPTKK